MALLEACDAPLQPRPQGDDLVLALQPLGEPAALDLVVQLGEGDPVVQTVDHQEVDQIGQRVRERLGAPLGIDGHQRVEPGAVLAERRALLVLPAGEDHEAVMAQGRLEQLAQPGPSVDLAPAAHVVPAHPLPVRAAQPRRPQLAGVEPGAEEQERHGTDAHGVVAARHGLLEGAVEVGEGLARPVRVYQLKSHSEMVSLSGRCGDSVTGGSPRSAARR
ncbi:hypothetical protein GCM10017744_014760 [Streptomyces antimycoticus]